MHEVLIYNPNSGTGNLKQVADKLADIFPSLPTMDFYRFDMDEEFPRLLLGFDMIYLLMGDGSTGTILRRVGRSRLQSSISDIQNEPTVTVLGGGTENNIFHALIEDPNQIRGLVEGLVSRSSRIITCARGGSLYQTLLTPGNIQFGNSNQELDFYWETGTGGSLFVLKKLEDMRHRRWPIWLKKIVGIFFSGIELYNKVKRDPQLAELSFGESPNTTIHVSQISIIRWPIMRYVLKMPIGYPQPTETVPADYLLYIRSGDARYPGSFLGRAIRQLLTAQFGRIPDDPVIICKPFTGNKQIVVAGNERLHIDSEIYHKPGGYKAVIVQTRPKISDRSVTVNSSWQIFPFPTEIY